MQNTMQKAKDWATVTTGGFNFNTGSYQPDKGQQATSGKYEYTGLKPEHIKGYGKNHLLGWWD
jgi:hypothetical protein